MKTKNIVLGLVALVFAAGSAFASLNMSVAGEQLRYRTLRSQNPEQCADKALACYPVTASCSGSGSSCFAAVTSSGLGGTVQTPIRVVSASSCQIITNANSNPVISFTDNCITQVDVNP